VSIDRRKHIKQHDPFTLRVLLTAIVAKKDSLASRSPS
jgi:hypothetical protein